MSGGARRGGGGGGGGGRGGAHGGRASGGTVSFGSADASSAPPPSRAQALSEKRKKSGGFQSLGLSPASFKAVMRAGYKVPTPIQRKAIPEALAGHDLVAMARTGSGKTAAFVIPLVERLRAHSQAGVRAVVLSPTRELAMQLHKVVKDFVRFTDLRVTLVVGGSSMERQFESLAAHPDVIVATPGRLMHQLLEVDEDLSLAGVEYCVFDEADRLFEMGFAAQLHEVLRRMGEHRQTLLFSATLPAQLVEFARAGLKNPKVVRLDVDTKVSERLITHALAVRPLEKPAVLLHLMRAVVPANQQALVFTATRHHVDYVHMLLERAGVSAAPVFGAMDPTTRKLNVSRFRSRRLRVLVVTDIAARGIDIPLLDNVINYHFPAKAKLFVHRVGRVARAGRAGTAYSLVAPDETPYLVDLQRFLGRTLNSSADAMPVAAPALASAATAAAAASAVEDDAEAAKRAKKERQKSKRKRRQAEARGEAAPPAAGGGAAADAWAVAAAEGALYAAGEADPGEFHAGQEEARGTGGGASEAARHERTADDADADKYVYFGRVPRVLVQECMDTVRKLSDQALESQAGAASRAYKAFLRTRPTTSAVSVREAKALLAAEVRDHPLMLASDPSVLGAVKGGTSSSSSGPSGGSGSSSSSSSSSSAVVVDEGEKVREMLRTLRSFKGTQTIFEVMEDTRNEVMVAKRRAHSHIIERNEELKALEEARARGDVSGEGEGEEQQEEEGAWEEEAEQQEEEEEQGEEQRQGGGKRRLSKAERKRLKKRGAQVAHAATADGPKRKRARVGGYRDAEHFVRAEPPRAHEERHYAVADLNGMAADGGVRSDSLVLDLGAGDDQDSMNRARAQKVWDRKKKKFVGVESAGKNAVPGVRKIRNESGAVVRGKNGKDVEHGLLYREWKKKSAAGRAGRAAGAAAAGVAPDDGDAGAADERRGAKRKKSGPAGGKVKSELKNRDQILKERMVKHRRAEHIKRRRQEKARRA